MAILSKIFPRSIQSDISIIDALKKMDSEGVKMLFVFENDNFISILTIGNIQRAIIKGYSLDTKVKEMVERDKFYANIHDSKEMIREKMKESRAECMPILNYDGSLFDVIFWEEIFGEGEQIQKKKINLPVVVMAGGKGTRLKPLTNIFPKPLIPVGEKTIIEEIMDKFETIGCEHFYISVNYKVDIMKLYFSQLEHKYNMTYFQEDIPLGTIGSISLLEGKINTPFIVTNCDIIIDQDFRDVYEYHISNKNDITVVTAIKSNQIPYGVIETGENGLLIDLKEKPETTFMFNSGAYILNPELIGEIPKGKMFHMTQLIEKIRERGGRIGCFPVSDHAWKDMGEWSEYLKMINVI